MINEFNIEKVSFFFICSCGRVRRRRRRRGRGRRREEGEEGERRRTGPAAKRKAKRRRRRGARRTKRRRPVAVEEGSGCHCRQMRKSGRCCRPRSREREHEIGRVNSAGVAVATYCTTRVKILRLDEFINQQPKTTVLFNAPSSSRNGGRSPRKPLSKETAGSRRLQIFCFSHSHVLVPRTMKDYRLIDWYRSYRHHQYHGAHDGDISHRLSGSVARAISSKTRWSTGTGGRSCCCCSCCCCSCPAGSSCWPCPVPPDSDDDDDDDDDPGLAVAAVASVGSGAISLIRPRMSWTFAFTTLVIRNWCARCSHSLSRCPVPIMRRRACQLMSWSLTISAKKSPRKSACSCRQAPKVAIVFAKVPWTPNGVMKCCGQRASEASESVSQ